MTKGKLLERIEAQKVSQRETEVAVLLAHQCNARISYQAARNTVPFTDGYMSEVTRLHANGLQATAARISAAARAFYERLYPCT